MFDNNVFKATINAGRIDAAILMLPNTSSYEKEVALKTSIDSRAYDLCAIIVESMDVDKALRVDKNFTNAFAYFLRLQAANMDNASIGVVIDKFTEKLRQRNPLLDRAVSSDEFMRQEGLIDQGSLLEIAGTAYSTGDEDLGALAVSKIGTQTLELMSTRRDFMANILNSHEPAIINQIAAAAKEEFSKRPPMGYSQLGLNKLIDNGEYGKMVTGFHIDGFSTTLDFIQFQARRAPLIATLLDQVPEIKEGKNAQDLNEALNYLLEKLNRLPSAQERADNKSLSDSDKVQIDHNLSIILQAAKDYGRNDIKELVTSKLSSEKAQAAEEQPSTKWRQNAMRGPISPSSRVG